MHVGKYVIITCAENKGRIFLNKTLEEFQFDCPHDNIFLGSKVLKGDDFIKLIDGQLSVVEAAACFDSSTVPKTSHEIQAWSEFLEAMRWYTTPEQQE